MDDLPSGIDCQQATTGWQVRDIEDMEFDFPMQGCLFSFGKRWLRDNNAVDAAQNGKAPTAPNRAEEGSAIIWCEGHRFAASNGGRNRDPLRGMCANTPRPVTCQGNCGPIGLGTVGRR